MGRSLSSLSPREAGHRITHLQVAGSHQGADSQFAWIWAFPAQEPSVLKHGKFCAHWVEMVPRPTSTVFIMTKVSGDRAGLRLPQSHLSCVPVPSWVILGLVTGGSVSLCSVPVAKGRAWQAC